jgi:hypothetical protein
MQGVGKDKKPLRLPPFPDIDLNNWQGFTVSHLHWVGVNYTAVPREEEGLLMTQVLDHEFCHKGLGKAPFSQLRQCEIFEIYRLILETVEEGLQQIQIPIKPAKSGNKLQNQWAAIVLLTKRSRLLEEVFAVRTSLLKALENGLIGRKMLRALIAEYKEKYERYIPSFSLAYNAFDLVAGKIGENATLGMIFNLFERLNPTAAFRAMIFDMCEIDDSSPNGFVWNVRDEVTAYMTSLSTDLAYGFFNGYIDYLDPTGSGYGKKSLLDYVAESKERWNAVADGMKDDFFKFLLESDITFVHSTIQLYEDSSLGLRFLEAFSGEDYVIREVEYGNFFVFLEAIRQQLIHGIGLVCPFWGYSPGHCCGGENKAILEKVWTCAVPTRPCRLWERRGCLAKDGGTH